MHEVPRSLQRLALEIEGWLDFRCPERALEKMGPLLTTPGARPAGLELRIRAMLLRDKWHEALASIAELRQHAHDPDWLDLTEAWCMKRVGNLSGSVECMERLLRRSHRSAIGHFNLGCYLALLGENDRAIDEVSVACGIEDQFRALAAVESDLVSLANDPRFRELLPPERDD